MNTIKKQFKELFGEANEIIKDNVISSTLQLEIKDIAKTEAKEMINSLICKVFSLNQANNIWDFFDVRDAQMVNFLVTHPNGKKMVRHIWRNVMSDNADVYISDLSQKTAKLVDFYKRFMKEIDCDIADLKHSSENLKTIRTEVFKRLSNQNSAYLAETRIVMLKIMKAEIQKRLKGYIVDLQKLKLLLEGREHNEMSYEEKESALKAHNKVIDKLNGKSYFNLIYKSK